MDYFAVVPVDYVYGFADCDDTPQIGVLIKLKPARLIGSNKHKKTLTIAIISFFFLSLFVGLVKIPEVHANSPTNNYVLSQSSSYYNADNLTGAIVYNGTNFASIWASCITDINSFGGGSIFLNSGVYIANYTGATTNSILPVCSNLLINGTGGSSEIQVAANLGEPVGQNSNGAYLLAVDWGGSAVSNVTITNLRLDGNNGNEPNYEPWVSGNPLNTMLVYGYNWTIQNDYISNWDSGIEVVTANYTLVQNNIFNASCSCVYIDYQSAFNVVQNNIMMNNLDNYAVMSVVQFPSSDYQGQNIISSNIINSTLGTVNETAIAVYKTNILTISNNQISGCSTGIDTTGPSSEDDTYLTITGNTIIGENSQGIYLGNAVNSIIKNNTINGSTYEGIQCAFSPNTIIENNTLNGNSQGRFEGTNIEIYGSQTLNCSIIGNYVNCTNGNSASGISNYNNPDNFTIAQNTIANCSFIALDLSGEGSGFANSYSDYQNVGFNDLLVSSGAITNPIRGTSAYIVDNNNQGGNNATWVNGKIYTNLGCPKNITVTGGTINGTSFLAMNPLDTCLLLFTGTPTVTVTPLVGLVLTNPAPTNTPTPTPTPTSTVTPTNTPNIYPAQSTNPNQPITQFNPTAGVSNNTIEFLALIAVVALIAFLGILAARKK